LPAARNNPRHIANKKTKIGVKEYRFSGILSLNTCFTLVIPRQNDVLTLSVGVAILAEDSGERFVSGPNMAP
jgi:hypothetical protein